MSEALGIILVIIIFGCFFIVLWQSSHKNSFEEEVRRIERSHMHVNEETPEQF